MLERIRIKDFQAHSDLRLRFDERVTTIVGDSDAGKSAVLRALWWLASNSLRGDAFVRDGSKSCSVYLWADGHKVIRSRGKGNSYSLDDQQYKAVSRDVPESISKLLNVADVNFQGQHDAPFWLSLSAPEVARQLNDVVDLGVIDKAQSAVASMLRNERSTLSVVEKRLKEAEAEKEQLSYVLEKEEDLSQLEQLEEQLQTERRKLHNLDSALRDIQQLRSDMNSIEVPDLSHLKTRHAALKGLHKQRRSLLSMLDTLNSKKKAIYLLEEELKQAEEELGEIGDICPTCGQTLKPLEV